MVTVIEWASSDYPAALRNKATLKCFPRIWAIGNLEILQARLLGFFCSIQCPGDVILRTYDLARALRDADIPVIGGFHSPMEKECLDLLLRGTQPVVICPARSIERIRLPITWHNPLDEGRLLILSPFEGKHRRPTAKLAEQRNRFVATLADEIVIAYAAVGSRTEQLCLELAEQGRRIHTLSSTENACPVRYCTLSDSVNELSGIILQNPKNG